MTFRILPLATDLVRSLRQGAPDANGQPAERAVAQGTGNPCRHCLCDIPEGAGTLILAHRPFATLHPYAECGPIFLCGDDCAAWQAAPDSLPPVLKGRDSFLVKGYHPTERIAYGTGATVPADQLSATITAILARADVAFADIRSSRNNCYQARAVRA
ncbi:DUF1203 domain-containing protein [Pseudooceanicola onchidii]|uniref:DUF1203 domain-containing protein n=1 Tax=Pseudooceanicola onchidii TaxID=2562279 RepID=UPI0010AA9A1B|nr:DUF1203 domain-containing protein [Pseudooceanicola onchidii]